MKTQWTMMLVACTVGCSSNANQAQLPPAAGGDGGAAVVRAPQAVEQGPIARAAVSAPVRSTGTTRPLRAANLASATSARIEKILVKEGDKVRAGQALLRLDARAASLAVSQAEASAAALEAQATRLSADYERLAPLVQKGAVAQSRVDQLASQRDAAKSQVEAAKAATDAARRVAVDATLSAPFAGTVVDVPVEVGEMSGSGTLVRLIDLSAVEVSVRINERDLGRVSAGDAVRAVFPGVGSEATGKVQRVGLEVDPANRTAELIVELPNPKGELRAGVFAELEITPSATRDAILVPRAALTGGSGDQAVFVIEGGVAKRRAVKTQPFDDLRVEVTEGLQGGEIIALAGVDRLGEGTPVIPATARAEVEASR